MVSRFRGWTRRGTSVASMHEAIVGTERDRPSHSRQERRWKPPASSLPQEAEVSMTASLTTLDELRAEIEREEMVLADYHARLAACMVEGKDMAPARELVRLAKDRLA